MSSKDCSLIEPLLGAYLDGEVSSETGESLAAHLEACENCRRMLTQLAETDRLLRGFTPEYPTEQQWAALEQRVLAGAGRRAVWKVAKTAVFAAAAALLLGAVVWFASNLENPVPEGPEAVEAKKEVEEEREDPPIPISIERRG